LLVMMAALANKFSLLIFDTDQYTLHLRIICLLAFWEIFNVVPDTLLRLRNASLHYSICQTVGFVVQLGFIVALVVYWHWGIQGILIGNLIGSVIENLLMFALTTRQLSWGFNYAELK